VNRAFFGRLAITPPSGDALEDGRLDIQLAPVAPRETLPAMALALGVVAIGLFPSLLGQLSEASTTAMAQVPVLVAAISQGGVG